MGHERCPDNMIRTQPSPPPVKTKVTEKKEKKSLRERIKWYDTWGMKEENRGGALERHGKTRQGRGGKRAYGVA